MTTTPNWTSRFSGLANVEPAERQTLEAAGRIIRLAKGSRVFGPGQTPNGYVLLLEGDIRISQVSESGREIVLYRVMPRGKLRADHGLPARRRGL